MIIYSHHLYSLHTFTCLPKCFCHNLGLSVLPHPHCTTLLHCCTVLHYNTSVHCTVQPYITSLHCTALHYYNALHNTTALHFSTLHYICLAYIAAVEPTVVFDVESVYQGLGSVTLMPLFHRIPADCFAAIGNTSLVPV